MHPFLIAVLGGTLLGFSAVGYLYIHGRIAGISGLIAQTISPQSWFKSSAFWFLLGLFITPFFFSFYQEPKIVLDTHPILLIIAGLLVGFGTRLGTGCTSGHGICGISRLSKRSVVATMPFMISAAFTVYVMRHMIGVN